MSFFKVGTCYSPSYVVLYIGPAGHVSIIYLGKVIHYIDVGSFGEQRIQPTKKEEVKLKHEVYGITSPSWLPASFFNEQSALTSA